MGDHKFYTSLDDRKYGEEFWSAGEEFCSCHGDLDGINESHTCTCSDADGNDVENDDDDDDDYETGFFVSNQFDPKKAVESVGCMKNAGFSNDLQPIQESIGSNNKKIGDDESESNIRCVREHQIPERQHTSKNDVSNSEQDWNPQSTRNHVIKEDCMKADMSKDLQEGTRNKDGKSGSLESTSRNRSSENKAAERSIGIKSKRIGLVVGDRQLTSVVGSTVLSRTENDQQKDKSLAQSKFQQKCSVKKAHETLGSHKATALSASLQTEQLIGGIETNIRYLHSYGHSRDTKKVDLKEQEKSLSIEKQSCVPEKHRLQSDVKSFNGEEDPHNDLPTSHLRDNEVRRRKPEASTIRNENDYNPSQIKDEIEDLMIFILTSKPDSMEENVEGAKMDTSFEDDAQQNGIKTNNSINDNKQRNQELEETNQNPKRKISKEAQSPAQQYQECTPNAETKGKDELLDNNEDHICNYCLKHLHESSRDLSDGESFQREELPQSDMSTDYLKNDDTKRWKFIKPVKQEDQGKLNDSEKSWVPCQRNNNTDDQIKSSKLSARVMSDLIAGTDKAEVDATYTTKDSISIRVNKHSDTDTRENPRDIEKQNIFHCLKYPHRPHRPAYERSDGKSKRKDVPYNDLQTNQLRNGDQHFKKGTHNKFEENETHTPSHQIRTQNADIKGRDKLPNSHDSGKQYCDHCFENINESSCDQSGARSFQREEVPQKGLITNHLQKDGAKRNKLLNQTKQKSQGKRDDSDESYKAFQRNGKTNDQIPSKRSQAPELPHRMSDVGKAETNPTNTSNNSTRGNEVHQTSQEQYYQATRDGGVKGKSLDDQNPDLKYPHDYSCNQNRRMQNLSTKKALRDDLQTKHFRNGDVKRTNHNSQGKLDDEEPTLSHQRRTQKADIQYPCGSLCAPNNDLPINRRNDEDSTQPLIRTHQNYQGKLNDMGKSRDLYQLNDETDTATSIKLSIPDESDAMTIMDMAITDAAFVTNPSIPISGNTGLSDTWSQKKHFYDMWMKGKFCDVNIVVDGQVFSVHRVVLAANSEYFERFVFDSPARTNDTGVLSVYITEMSADIFRVILRYMYTGRIDIQFSQVSQLLTGSLFLSIKSLTSALQDFLLKAWKGECIGAFCLAQTAGLHDLHKVILNYIRTHFVEVSNSEHFALCPAEYVSAILTDDNLWINEETDVLYAVLLWLEHHTRDISSNLRLLRHVRFEYIPLATIDRIEKGDLKSLANESVKRYIHDARKRASCLGEHQLHFDPPIIRQRLPDVVKCCTLRTNGSQIIESTNVDRSFQASDMEKHVNPSNSSHTSAHSRDSSISPSKSHSPSSSKSCYSVKIKSSPFPSYHEIDTNPIRVSVSQDVTTTSPALSNDDLIGSSSKDLAEDESNVEVVRIGGISRTWEEDYVHNDIEKIENGRGKRWEEWTSFAELPVAMHHHAACYIHNSLYISGGHVQLPCDARSNHFQPSRLFHVYDLMKEKWYRLADLEQARVFHQMVALFGQLYVIGGQGHDGGALSAVERYSPYTDSWRHVTPLSFPRYATAAAAYNFHLWVVGGASNHVTSQNADGQQRSSEEGGTSVYGGFYKSTSTFLTAIVECYSPHNNSWTKINDLPTPRCHASLIRINKRLFLVGGFCSIRHKPADDSSTSSVDVLDDISESWRYVSDVGEGNYSANTVVVGSKIVILGKPGPFLESSGDVISIFDTSTNKWELRRSLLLEARVGHACCAIPVPSHSKLCQKMKMY